MIQTQAGYHSNKTHLLLYLSYGTTAYGQALAFHLLLHVCHELKWRKYSLKFNGALLKTKHCISAKSSTTYKPSLCTLHPNKSVTLLWYNIFLSVPIYYILYKVLNTGINPWRWPSIVEIWNMWEKVQYNDMYTLYVPTFYLYNRNISQCTKWIM
jgi:hypothetical protein